MNHWLDFPSLRSLSETAPAFLLATTLPQRYFPAHLQYAYASHQSTPTTGRLAPASPRSGAKLVFHAHSGGCVFGSTAAATNCVYCAFVTSVVSTQNELSGAPTRSDVGPFPDGHGPASRMTFESGFASS